jgi:hypothetical protein
VQHDLYHSRLRLALPVALGLLPVVPAARLQPVLPVVVRVLVPHHLTEALLLHGLTAAARRFALLRQAAVPVPLRLPAVPALLPQAVVVIAVLTRRAAAPRRAGVQRQGVLRVATRRAVVQRQADPPGLHVPLLRAVLPLQHALRVAVVAVESNLVR